MNDLVKVMLIGHRPLIQFSLEMLIGSDKRFKLCQSYSSTSSLIEKLQENLPQLLILDLEFFDDDGQPILRLIKYKFPEIKVIIVATRNINPRLKYHISLGIKGLIYGDCEPTEVIETLQNVTRKGFFFNEEATKYLLESIVTDNLTLQLNNQLSVREAEVLTELRKGKTEKEIGEILCITKATVHFHKKNLYLKTNSHSLIQLLNNTNDIPISVGLAS